MKTTASRSTRLAPMNPAIEAVGSLLRGVGQVMFQNNPITGLLFLVGIFINSYEYGLSALLGLVVATLAAYLLGADRTLIRNGLFGFNGVLTGIALSVFLQWDWHVAVYIILGAIVSTIVMTGLAKTARQLGHGTGDRPVRPDGLAAAVRPLPVRPAASDETDRPDPGAPGCRDPDRTERGRRQWGHGVDGGQPRQRLVPRGGRGVPPGQLLDRRGLRDRHPGQLAGLFGFRAARLGTRRPDRLSARRRRGHDLPRALRLQRGPDRDRPRRRVPGAQLVLDDLRVNRGDLQRARVCRYHGRAVPDRHASAHRPVRAHDLGVPAADVRFQITAAGLGRRGAQPKVDPRGLSCAGSRRPAEASKVTATSRPAPAIERSSEVV